MASRKEEKERLRQERIAREQAEATAAARRRRLIFGGGAVVVIAVIAIVAIAIASSGGGSSKKSSPKTASGGLPGLQISPAPWQPEYANLSQRIQDMGLPQIGQETYHIHAMLRIYINGKQEPVPANIGLDPQGQFGAPLHTHDSSGIMHLETDNPYPFKLGQFFDVWGVKFTDTQIGAYYNQGKNTLQVYVNGKKISDPVNYVIKRHDAIAVGYGPPGSFPTKFKAVFPNGL